MNYCGIYNWSCDLPEGTKDIFYTTLDQVAKTRKPNILEVGVFTGTHVRTSITWIRCSCRYHTMNLKYVMPLTKKNEIEEYTNNLVKNMDGLSIPT